MGLQIYNESMFTSVANFLFKHLRKCVDDSKSDNDLSNEIKHQLRNLPEFYNHFFVYINHGKVVGTIALQYVENKCNLKNIYVEEEERGKKIGLILMELAENTAEIDGYKNLRIVANKDLLKAHEFYTFRGFSCTSSDAKYKFFEKDIS
jgi:N-acetylglutamate synthase-like GNAT family acetyltransferase